MAERTGLKLPNPEETVLAASSDKEVELDMVASNMSLNKTPNKEKQEKPPLNLFV